MSPHRSKACKLKDNDNLKKVYIQRDKSKDELEAIKKIRQQCYNMNFNLNKRDDEGRRYGKESGVEFFYSIRNQQVVKIDRATMRVIKTEMFLTVSFD